MRDKAGPPRVAPFLFFSGACALIYQVTWVRELRLIFGASTGASAAVLAVFMGGLGIGGVWLGKKIDSSKTKPLVFYSHLELLISLSAGLTPVLIFLAKKIYFGVGGSTTLGGGGATVLRLILATLVLIVPTVLMGGTMPAAARAVSTHTDSGRSGVATLYGVNTVGAVAGAMLANFVLLEVMGNLLTLLTTCLINVLVGIAARAVGRDSELQPTAEDEAKASDEAEAEPTKATEKAKDDVGVPMPVWFPLAAAGVSGFAFLLMELVWYRMLGPVLGGSSYTFGLILAAALLGIGVGGLLYAVVGRRAATLNAFAVTCALEALFIAVPYALGDRIAEISLLLRSLGTLGFLGHAATWGMVTTIVVVPAAVVSGFQFPLVIGLFGRGNTQIARHVGVAYAANTVGAILGSLAGGFGLLPALTATGCWRLVAYMLGATALVTIYLSFRSKETQRAGGIVSLVTAGLAVYLSATSIGPTAAWRHTPIGAGRADAFAHPGSQNGLTNYFNRQRRSVLWGVDGVESAVGLDTRMGTAFVVNGKSDGDARQDAGTQVMSGLIGAALVPNPKRALVIGLGTGSTAGWLGTIPEMESVDVVELEPAILHVAEVCAPVNQNVLANPKVHITIGDAREALLTSRGTYDVIFSEPSNPYRAGIASLYTLEFYQASKLRLSADGAFVQWIQAYEIDGAAIRVAIVTMSQVFKNVSVWRGGAGDLLLVGSDSGRIDGQRLQARAASEPYKTALRTVYQSEGIEGFLSHHLATPELTHKIADRNADLVNTDDRNLLEYAFARNVGRSKANVEGEFWRLSRSQKTDRPVLDNARVNWARVEAYRREFGEGTPPESQEEARLQAGISAYQSGDIRRFANELIALHAEPRTFIELEAAAEGLADLGDEDAARYIERLRPINSVEADLALARLRIRQGRLADAIEPYEHALIAFRTNPWPVQDFALRGLALSGAFASDKGIARRAYLALSQPFSINLANEERQLTRIRLARNIDWAGLCVEAFTPFEEFPPWTFSFLRQRLDCYATVHSPLEAKAKADLLQYLSLAPTTIAGDLDTGPAGNTTLSPSPKSNAGAAGGGTESDEPSEPTPNDQAPPQPVPPPAPAPGAAPSASTAIDAGAPTAPGPGDAGMARDR